MQKLKRPLSILLSVVLILSMFTIIPMTSASAANGDTVSAEVGKWVKGVYQGENNGSVYRFTDLYQGVIFCRVNPDKVDDFDSLENKWAGDVVYNQTADLTLGGNTCWLFGYNGDQINASWSNESGREDAIYAVAQNGIQTGAVIYAWTFETFNLTEHSAVSPTFSNGTYNNGSIEYYTAGDRYFKKTGDDPVTFEQITPEETVVPYFEYSYDSFDQAIYLNKCNSDDASITVPDVVPAQFYPSDAPEGAVCTKIAEEAFKDRTNLVNVIIGDNVSRLAEGHGNLMGSFYGCTSLESVTVGSGLYSVGSNCFKGCTRLTDFTTTATESSNNFNGIIDIANDNQGLTVHCYHNSTIGRYLSNKAYITREFLDEPVEHIYRAWNWNWNGFNEDDLSNSHVYVEIDCSVCYKDFAVVEAEIVQVVDTPPTCVSNGIGHYRGIAAYEGQTFINDPLSYYDNNKFPYIIPATPNDHDWDTAASAVDWTWTPDGGEDPGLSEITATATVHCKNCETTQTLNAVVEYTGSDLPGCTTDGSAHYTASARCGGEALLDTKDYTLPAEGHSLCYHADVPAAAAAEGNNEYWECTKCGMCFSDQYGENEIEEGSWIIPELNLVEAGKVFEVGDEIVIPAGTTITMYGRTGNTASDVTFSEKTVTTVQYYDTQTDGKHGRIWLEGYDNYYLRDASSNNSYVFTGCYRFVDQFNNGKLVAEPLFYKTATEPTWADWSGSDETAAVTLSDFYDAATNGAAVDCSQTIDAEIDDGVVVTEAAMFTDGEILYTATATACHGVFTATKTETIPKTAPAYTIEDDTYYSTFSEAADKALDNNGSLTVVLLKNIEDNYLIPAEKAAYTLKVKKNGHSVTIKSPSGYHVYNSTSDGVTSYKLHKLTEHPAVTPTYNRDTNTVTVGHNHYWRCNACNMLTDSATGERMYIGKVIDINYYQYEWTGNRAELKGYNGSDSEIYIPAKIPNGYPGTMGTYSGTAIKWIMEGAFRNKTVLTKVEAPAITSIRSNAFSGCANLEEFIGGSNLSYIESGAFANCPNLKKFYTTANSLDLQYDGVFTGSPNVIVYAPHGSAYKGWARTQGRKFIGIDAHDAPRWNWTGSDEDGYTAATATFNCSRCAVNETVNAVVTSEAADGVITYTATAELEGNIYTATKTVVNPKLYYFPKHSLTLNGDIGVNFYLNLSETELAQGVRVDFAWNGKSESVTFNSESTAETKPGAEGLYKATCYVCAAEMNDEITVSVTVGDSTEPTATETYKVRDYADVIIENKDGKFSDALIALVKTMLNYGAAAQNQFSHNTNALANAGVNYGLAGLSENEVSGIAGDIPNKAAINALLTESGIEYYGYSLILKTKTTLRFYFKKNGADTSQLALVNGDNVNIGTVKDYNDAYCYIEIEGIPAYELGDCYTLKYGDISLGSFSALSYAKDVLLNDNGAQPITDTATALYRYNEAAVTHFNSIA